MTTLSVKVASLSPGIASLKYICQAILELDNQNHKGGSSGEPFETLLKIYRV